MRTRSALLVACTSSRWRSGASCIAAAGQLMAALGCKNPAMCSAIAMRGHAVPHGQCRTAGALALFRHAVVRSVCPLQGHGIVLPWDCVLLHLVGCACILYPGILPATQPYQAAPCCTIRCRLQAPYIRASADHLRGETGVDEQPTPRWAKDSHRWSRKAPR